MSTILNPFRLICEEDRDKFTQKQHDILRNNYEKIFILEREIEKYTILLEKYKIENDMNNIMKTNENITNMNKEYEKSNIMQTAILDFIF